jgi:hypothetical protein
MPTTTVGRRARAQASWRRPDARARLISAAPEKSLGGAVAPLLEQLSARGYLVIQLPQEVLEQIAAVRRCMLKFFSGSIAEKDRFRTRQDGERVLSHPGYLTPAPGWAELFEVRRSCRDASYRFPPRCEAPCMRLFDALRALALRW